jgi:hypothetical protein
LNAWDLVVRHYLLGIGSSLLAVGLRAFPNCQLLNANCELLTAKLPIPKQKVGSRPLVLLAEALPPIPGCPECSGGVQQTPNAVPHHNNFNYSTPEAAETQKQSAPARHALSIRCGNSLRDSPDALCRAVNDQSNHPAEPHKVRSPRPERTRRESQGILGSQSAVTMRMSPRSSWVSLLG